MGKKRKEHGDEGQSRAKRTQLLTPYDDMHDNSEDEALEPHDLAFLLDHYSADCFVDATLMIVEEACVARGTFRDARGREVLVHVPTRSFFNLACPGCQCTTHLERPMHGRLFCTFGMGTQPQKGMGSAQHT